MRPWARPLTGSVLGLLLRGSAWADHGAGAARDPGLGLGWLFVGGGVAVIALAAWAVFAPSREEPDDEDRTR